jgi:DNA-binding beta-propeller fold protein YncE
MKLFKYLALLAAVAGASSCTLDAKYTVGGNVSGLLGTGLSIEDNGGDQLTVTANGAFIFATGVKNGDAFSVTVSTQPTDPAQTCTVHNGSGAIDRADITNVVVTCTQAGRFAYVANQGSNDISAFAIDQSTGVLIPIAGSPFASTGTGPVAVAVDPNETYLYVVNNGSNDVSVYSIDYTTGALTSSGDGITTGNQPTGVVIDPTDQYLYVTNSSDATVSAFTLSGGVATAIAGSPYVTGNTPFAVKTDPGGNFLYVTNFTDGTVSVFAIGQGTGELTAISGSPFGAGAGSVAIAIDPAGTFAYVANETAASISAFSINSATGGLVPVSGSPFGTGTSPEALAVNPAGSFLYAANVTSKDDVGAFTITPSTGAIALASTAGAESLPFAVAVDPGGQFVYAANDGSGDVSVYTVDSATGALTAVAGSPFPSGSGARSIAIY